MIEVDKTQLAHAILNTHSCTATFERVERVTEEFDGQTVWDGIVHAFAVDHPETDTCYAWSSPVEGSENRRFYAVLGIPPINTARDAVRAAIVTERKGN